jgi:hypothetical protein
MPREKFPGVFYLEWKILSIRGKSERERINRYLIASNQCVAGENSFHADISEPEQSRIDCRIETNIYGKRNSWEPYFRISILWFSPEGTTITS